MEPVLHMEGVTLTHKATGKQLLHNVSFQAGKGQIIGIIGNSGSGKSVLLESIIRILSFPVELTGSIQLGGKELTSLNERSFNAIRGKDLAFIPTGGKMYLNPVVPIGKQLIRILRTHANVSEAEAKQRVLEWLANVSIPDPGNRMFAYPHELSGGMAQRVVIAAAMLNEPSLILADEPTAGLDVTVQRQILDLLSQVIRQAGTSCLLVTRDLGIVASYCDKVLVMDGGEAVELQDTRSFFRSPASKAGQQMIQMMLDEQQQINRMSTPKGMRTEPVVSIHELYKVFTLGKRKVNAINGVSFSIQPGETLSMVGESGSGKTTVGRCIAGLEKPTSGLISHGNGKARIGMVFQEPFESLNPRHTIRRILSEPLRIMGKESHDEIMNEVLAKVNLSPSVLDRYPFELRPNEQQRIGIARALMNDPDLIVLDEPTSMLDPATRMDILTILKKIQEETGIAYLFISHDLSAVQLLGGIMAVMYLGEIVEIGRTEQLFQSPLHPYTQSLMSSVLHPDPDKQLQEMKLTNEIPSPLNLPKGCFLAPRCPYATAECHQQHPELMERNGSDRMVACLQYSDKGEQALWEKEA